MPISPFTGMTQLQLQQALTSAQAALIALQTGGKPVSLSYAQGDGSKSITYSAAEQGALGLLIRQLQRELGLIDRVRRPMRLRFT